MTIEDCNVTDTGQTRSASYANKRWYKYKCYIFIASVPIFST